MCRRIGEHGAALIPDGARVLTHCNAGALATGGIGTALAAIYVAVEQGKRVEVFADETRPLLQGSRLTAWELQRAGIPVTVLVDGAAASLMRERTIDLCIVGADRIARERRRGEQDRHLSAGDRRGASRHSVLRRGAGEHVRSGDASGRARFTSSSATPTRCACGFGALTAPADVDVYNPAFDVTPASLITAIVSDRGVHRAAIRVLSNQRDEIHPGDRRRHDRRDLPDDRRGRPRRRPRLPRDPAVLSAARLGRARRDGDSRLRATGARATAIAQAGAQPVAIGITNQRETVVIWERATGRPVHRAIVWQDRRTRARCQELAPRAEWIARAHRARARSVLLGDARSNGCSASSGCSSATRRASSRSGTIDSWLVWQLTGGAVHATDPTNASRTMLYDIDAHRVERRAVRRCSACRWRCCRRCAARAATSASRAPSIFGAEIPILGIAGDQQAALFGQGCWTRGTGKNTYGTGAFLLLNAGASARARRGGLLTTIACDATGAPAYALEAAIFIAGAAVQWLRDGLGIIEQRRAKRKRSRGRSQSTDGVYFVPALTGLGAPHWESRRARHDRRAHARHGASASGARGARGDGVWNGRRAGQYERGERRDASTGCASTAARRRTTG